MGNVIRNKFAPTFEFFYVPPETFDKLDDKKRLALICSVQAFESSLALLASRRIPHSLITIVSSIETALKAHLLPHRNATLHELFSFWRKTLNPSWKNKLNKLKNTRNSIIHEGYSPQYDDRCGRLLMDVAYPALFEIYSAMYNYNDFKSAEMYKAISRTLEWRKVLLNKNFDDAKYPFIHIQSFLKEHYRDRYSTQLQYEAVLFSDDRLDYSSKIREKIEDEYGLAVRVGCPNCHECYTLICALSDEVELAPYNIDPLMVYCTACLFYIPEKYKFFCKPFATKSLEEAADDIATSGSIVWG